jgi:molecular chaperone GrpE (heat shock protein)
MKPATELVPGPVSLSSHNEPPALGIATLIEGLADVLIDAGPVVRQLEERAAQHRQQQLQFQQKTEAALARQEEYLLQINQGMSRVEQASGSIIREAAKCAEQSSRLNQCLETMEFNLEQLRLLADVSVQQQQQLVDDFIERRVTDHLFKEFLNIQFALARYSANGDPNLRANIQATAEAIESFLTESGLRIIRPAPGAPFEPREHQPIKVLPAGNAQADGTIAETFTPGLSRSRRVIQQARVAVFKADAVKTTS